MRDDDDRPGLLARLMKLLGFAVLATALLAMAFHAPDRSLESLVARWAPPPSDFLELPVAEGRLQLVHLRDEGPREDPTPIILMHGTAASLHTFEGWVSELKTRHRVITLDLPGFGLTGPSVSNDYTDEGYDRFLQALMAQLKISRAVLGGNSQGASIAWQYAGRHPEQVAALVLAAPGGMPVPGEAIPAEFRLPDWWLVRSVAHSFLPRPIVERNVKSSYGDPAKVTAAVVDRYFELILREGNRDALVRLMAQRRPGQHADLLDRIQAPTLILWGGKDHLIPSNGAEVFASRIKQAQVQVFPELGHVLQEEDPKATVGPVLAFLSAL